MTNKGLLDPSSLRVIANEIGLRPSKQKGQNFVHDANTVNRIVSLAEIGPADSVLEIGPGLGSLTLGLLSTAKKVVTIEIDSRLANQLPATVKERMPEAADKLTVITADALTVNELPFSVDCLVANLPYNVAVPIILHLLEVFPSWRKGLVMVQLEVAERLVSSPGNKIYGVPSAKLAWYGTAEKIGLVGPKVFWPVPNVDSGLVKITRRPTIKTTATRKQVFTVIDAVFKQRRKMIRSALASIAGSASEAATILQSAGVDPQCRGEMLNITDFAAIAARLFHKNDF